MKRLIWILTAILLIGGANMLTSCSNHDDEDDQFPASGPGPLAEKLTGIWYTVYEAQGTAVYENRNNGESADYIVVIDVYHFDARGTGTFQRFFFDDDETSPAVVHGLLGYGDFTYSSTAAGKVRLTLKNQWNQSYPQSWDVSYAADVLTAKGVDGRELKLEKADAETAETLSNMAEQNGSADSGTYTADSYKPTGVDNSQWMKQLADSRLVADLSLPGSHDACTAEGWESKLFGAIYEMTAKAQDLTISEQLKVGVRVFDLRPEYNIEAGGYKLRCMHGIAGTKLLVKDFFQILKQWLAEHPTEFCVLTVDLSNTTDKNAWGKEFHALVTSSDFKSMFADFKPRLTVGELRGKVLMLSKWEYAPTPVGGYCYGWGYDLELEKQQQGHIKGADGIETPLWVQDYWGKKTRDGKDDAVLRMLEAAAGRDMGAATPAWVINYPSAYFGGPFSDSYRENAVEANKVTIDWLSGHTGSVGIIYMDFAGMDKSPNYGGSKLYDTVGMKLVDSVIKQNWK